MVLATGARPRHLPPHREGSHLLTARPTQPVRNRQPDTIIPPTTMPCNQEAAGRGRERARGSPGPHRAGHHALQPPGLCRRPAAGRAALTYLATDHRGGDREGQRGPQAAASLSAGVRPRRLGRPGALSHSGFLGTRGTSGTWAPQHPGRGGRRSPAGGKLGWAPARPGAEPLALGAGRGWGRGRGAAPPLGLGPED